MARNLFGGTTADVAEDIDGRRVPGAVGTVWDGPSDGARQLTDLTDVDGAPIIQLVADVRGFVPSFYGPANDAERVWVDFGVGRIALVSVTVGDRLRKHLLDTDPHQSRAYTDERLSGYLPTRGTEVQSPVGDTWLSAVVTDDSTGNVIRLRTADGTERTRLRNTGALYLDTIGKKAPLCIGAPGYGPGQTVINVSSTAASPANEGAVFQVKGDGSVISSGTVTASNLGNARLWSGPLPPPAPRTGDVWVKLG
ncbi:hypothetical protein [Streptomyces eurocidicus]|uniref:Uncharacterized protein n=1 Tax=Streptomyces eurocidicus TaxID=66423 RepID=A0A7W8F7E1_STREU|nr:hypothetical protein [Streptomyces eurocidicus]MBB5123271.1 hypothetical protein [Streptomyces eurocidicus]